MSGRAIKTLRVVPLAVITILSGLVGIAGYWRVSPGSESRRFFWANSGGAVMFEHDTHSATAGQCADCHHDLFTSDGRIACTECHGEDYTVGDFSHDDLKAIEGHDCGYCHQVNGSLTAGSCRSCHPSVQDDEATTGNCQDCHGEDYTPDILTHDELLAVESHRCSVCHVTITISDAYHRRCQRCHARENPVRFVDAEGGPRCRRCHLK
jgi:hypothetical protein